MVQTILMPTDGSETAEAAMRFVADVARSEQARVVALSVAHGQIWGDTTEAYDPPALRAEAERVAEQQAAELRKAGVEATTRVVPADNVADAIERVAGEEHADLIVMGTHGHTGFARAIIGSVADRVVRHASVPVLLVPITHAMEKSGETRMAGAARA